jgi:hypothetical protein
MNAVVVESSNYSDLEMKISMSKKKWKIVVKRTAMGKRLRFFFAMFSTSAYVYMYSFVLSSNQIY